MSADKGIRDLAVLILLAVNAVKDVREHEISLPSCAAGAFIGALLAGGGRNDLPAGFALSAVPGVISLLITFVTGGAIGAGDGIMLLTLGIFYPVSELAAMLSAACMLSAIYGGVLLMRQHPGKEKYAFVPFLFMGFAAVRFMEGGG